ncbi:MAG: oxidative damage protection protein [Chromatiales bacterium]|nr:oxidative damage protection protein [Chromatiales bacterium]
MSRTVQCVVLGRAAPGLDRPPIPGELGQRVFDQVSREGWQRWLERQTMLINEHRLKVFDPAARAFLERELERFAFGDGGEAPEGFTSVSD